MFFILNDLNTVVQIPEPRCPRILCVEGLADPEDEFKGTVEKHALKGLKFEKIWSEIALLCPQH